MLKLNKVEITGINMDFGNVDSLKQIDFSLPKNHPRSYIAAPQGDFKCYLSLPVWGDDDFLGKIYPIRTSKDEQLKIFTQNFNSIELNSSFYGTPRMSSINKWKEIIPDSFKFSIKTPRSISHEGLDIHEFNYFLKTIKELGSNLANVFLQLAPSFSPINAKELILFLKQMPRGIDLYIEFRHPAWFKEGLNSEKFYEYMEKNSIYTVLTDVAGRRDVLSMRLTGPKVMIRFKGYGLVSSDYQRLDDWTLRLKEWRIKGLTELYFFLHQKNQHHGIDLAEYLIPKFNAELGAKLIMPKRVDSLEQISLI